MGTKQTFDTADLRFQFLLIGMHALYSALQTGNLGFEGSIVIADHMHRRLFFIQLILQPLDGLPAADKKKDNKRPIQI